ncbi:hypothetical protein TL16_g05230 [Triparma laevis f. inornata]|uniref:Uncharacterized protein n=1 Tax=Triparma laevis f. inornata TaxID=1714386 RepID=A0A9W7AL39_9STRA|nr:hypothetical protein TL16_g05230 [Triparma laevis f. inornata]
MKDKVNDERSKKDRIQIDNESKNEHLKKLQKKLERLIRDQTAELESSESKTQSMSDNADDRMRSLGKNKEQYNILLESYPVVERENTNLRHVVNNLKEELSTLRAKNSHSLTSLKKEMFDIRMKIEFEFMRTKKTYEKKYQLNAQNQMKEESERAVIECSRLSGILKGKKYVVEDMMKSQEKKAILLKKEKVEKVLVGSALSMQQNEIELLERLMKEQEVVINKCQSEITKLHSNLKRLQKEERDISIAEGELNVTRKNYGVAQVEKNSWKIKVKSLVVEVDDWVEMGCPLESRVGFIEGSYFSSEVGDQGGSSLEIKEEEEEEGGDEIWRASSNIGLNSTVRLDVF